MSHAMTDHKTLLQACDALLQPCQIGKNGGLDCIRRSCPKAQRHNMADHSGPLLPHRAAFPARI